ncbi:MAG: MoaD family protein [Candidatus Cloacimonetes bacterium]|nr:MoaD family protein [Candidatus Cloacimonadota bacterium]MCF7812929.1 MoaD family protein [Candidatus Cloacimonadota bacterium]MCF7867141.1 MoaD family protein [Candidatus Cloacimonadota bacterium]MCF7882539.1 MoaD family protein [Candidatus Cloacimonadota bacterium]
MIKIKFYSLIRLQLGINAIDIEAESISIYDLLQKTEKKIGKKFIDLLFGSEKEILHGTMILINGRNIWHLDNLDSIVSDGDEISIFPPGGGG